MVKKCVCFNVTFAKICEMVNDRKIPLSQVIEETRAGKGCSRCIPYINHAIETGQTEIPVGGFLKSRKDNDDSR